MTDFKIISLLPAATEIVCALGLEKQLVGRSHECDFPQEIRNLPICSSAKFLPGADSLQIDTQVKEILSDGLSIYTINTELIRTLKPDVIITQAQCDVCAVSLKDVEQALEGLLDKECTIVSLEPKILSDVFNDIKNIAGLMEVSERADDVLERGNERLDIIRHKLKFLSDKPKVACIEWLSPLMIAGHWTPEMVEIAGGEAVLAINGKHSSFITFEEIKAIDPEIIIVMPCGFSIQRTLQEVNILLDLPGWQELKAVVNNRVYIADGNQYFNRSGPRLIDSIEVLAEIINPKQFVFGYEGEGWVKFGV